MKEYIQAARRLKKADILLKNGQLVNVISGEIYPANIFIYKDRVVGISKRGANTGTTVLPVATPRSSSG